jgi:hypothetical protein
MRPIKSPSVTRLGVGITAVFAGLALSVPASAAEPKAAVTYAKDVAPIMQEKCQNCHRPGEVAPMSLLTYQDTRPCARSIKQKVQARLMPPWHIDKTVGIQSFKNDISLSDDQIDTISRWVDAGAPLGDAKDLPPAKVFETNNEWHLAAQFGQKEPDLIIRATPYTMDAKTQDKWWKPVTDIGLTEMRWVRAVETRTRTIEGRKILHHAVASLIQDEKLAPPEFRISSADAGNDDDPDTPDRNAAGLFSEWAIGKTGDVYRDGSGKLLLPGSKISWDIHLSQAMGGETAVTAEVELGVYLYPKGYTPKYRTILTNMGASRGRGIDIPPGQIAATQGFTVLRRGPARLENFQPHMHLRGKAMALEAILPNGQRQMLSFVNNFQFNWMNSYEYTDDDAPLLPQGTIISVTAWHDNTPGNKNNPDPTQWVGNGDRSIDEMAHAWVNVTYLTQEDYKAELAKRKAKQAAQQTQDQQ